MSSKVTALPVKRTFGETMRDDAWWIQPAVVFLGFSAFIVYSTWAAFQGEFYAYGNLLSPFYSPEIWYPLGGADCNRKPEAGRLGPVGAGRKTQPGRAGGAVGPGPGGG